MDHKLRNCQSKLWLFSDIRGFLIRLSSFTLLTEGDFDLRRCFWRFFQAWGPSIFCEDWLLNDDLVFLGKFTLPHRRLGLSYANWRLTWGEGELCTRHWLGEGWKLYWIEGLPGNSLQDSVLCNFYFIDSIVKRQGFLYNIFSRPLLRDRIPRDLVNGQAPFFCQTVTHIVLFLRGHPNACPLGWLVEILVSSHRFSLECILWQLPWTIRDIRGRRGVATRSVADWVRLGDRSLGDDAQLTQEVVVYRVEALALEVFVLLGLYRALSFLHYDLA